MIFVCLPQFGLPRSTSILFGKSRLRCGKVKRIPLRMRGNRCDPDVWICEQISGGKRVICDLTVTFGRALREAQLLGVAGPPRICGSLRMPNGWVRMCELIRDLRPIAAFIC